VLAALSDVEHVGNICERRSSGTVEFVVGLNAALSLFS
jgi:hypothetical protein